MQNIVGKTDFDNSDSEENNSSIPLKYNLSWGTDYMLMDSKNFMSCKNGADYTQVIDMFQKIWDMYQYRLISVF
jgi:hypothetical protein